MVTDNNSQTNETMKGIIDLDCGMIPLDPTEFGTDNTRFFELLSADHLQTSWIMTIIVGRCAGVNMDPDSDESWENFKDIDISIVRSSKPMPEAMEIHNQVSDNLWEFTVEELAEDYTSDDTNPYVEQICHAVAKLPIGRVSSHFFVKVVLSS